jgi:hypothetical protein
MPATKKAVVKKTPAKKTPAKNAVVKKAPAGELPVVPFESQRAYWPLRQGQAGDGCGNHEVRSRHCCP